MTTRAIYKMTFDEDVQPDSNANQCPERGAREAHTTFLYDEADHGIETDDQLATFLEDDSDELWLLPALALHRTTSDEDVDDREAHHH